MWEIRSIDLGARAAFVATLRFYFARLCRSPQKFWNETADEGVSIGQCPLVH